MVHGPVGIRCRDCLYPQGEGGHLLTPERVASAKRLSLGLAIGWLVLMVAVGIFSGINLGVWTPNLALAALAGITVGLAIWHRSGRAWNPVTRAWALWLGLLMPVGAAAILMLVLIVAAGLPSWFALLVYLARIGMAVAVSVLLCWLVATQRSGL
jgi:hypothetical protein